jgi:SAM-dependent methyltransferase
MVGLRIANAFHPQMWRVRVHGISAVERFQDDNILRSVLIKAAHFWPNRRCWNAQCVRSLMRVHHRTRVMNFRPTVAKAIIETYSRDNARVLDFCAGYGGRLLGALSLRRHYIGIEPARAQIQGLRRMHMAIRPMAIGSAELHRACAEDFLTDVRTTSIDLVFSSPPYFNLERYSDEPTQSYRRYPTYAAWRDRFLTTVIRETHRVLRPGGQFVLNVANTEAGPVARDALALAKRHFTLREALRLVMHATPAERARGRLYRSEPVYVFTRPRG